ncbi:MAG: hypothetical protein L0216_00105 [Planctomycetales bacterium]|nr:hypothetical protein [Planctomycetales bacterium]
MEPLTRWVEARRLLDQGVARSRADLSRFLGVTRARVTQLLALDRIAPDVWAWLTGDGAPFREIVSENLLRQVARKPPAHQLPALRAWCRWVRGGPES